MLPNGKPSAAKIGRNRAFCRLKLVLPGRLFRIRKRREDLTKRADCGHKVAIFAAMLFPIPHQFQRFRTTFDMRRSAKVSTARITGGTVSNCPPLWQACGEVRPSRATASNTSLSGFAPDLSGTRSRPAASLVLNSGAGGQSRRRDPCHHGENPQPLSGVGLENPQKKKPCENRASSFLDGTGGRTRTDTSCDSRF